MAMDLFKDLSSFLVRVKIHTHSQNNTVPELKLELTEILCQFLIVMGTAYSTVKRSRLKRLAKYLARTPDSIVEQVREFKRICSNLDRLLLSLIFEATYSPVYQHHHPSPLHTPAEAGPSTSNRFPLSKDRDDTLVAPPASPKYRSTVTEGTSGESLDGSSPEMLPLVQSPKSMAPSHAVSSPADSELSTTVGRSLSPVVQPVQSTPGVHGNVRAYSTAAGLKILCLDGGGVRGLIEILVLEEILERLAFDLNRDLKPCDVFDIIVGTGTGGLVAVLFGRLGLSIQQAVDVYCDIFRAVADEDTVDKKTRRFEKKVKEIVERFTKNSETKMFSADSPSKTILCAMPAHNLPHLRIFRSYRARTNQCIDCAIWEATRATTTMPSIFSDIEIARGFQHDLFVDGGLRCHNPTMELMKELEDNFRDSELACIVSIGAGKPAVASPDYAASSSQSSMDKTLLAVAIDCEKTAEAASKHFEAAREKGAGGSVPYWRFNTEPGIQGNVEWNRISEMVSHVKSYLAGSSVQRDVDELVETLAKHPRLVDSGLHR
ncbi:acyl transferase/acyl hydrolase/lysophospholipase [Flagelloscypha sp. PMI_526]|nr:acyl transferase/acyl hydrolase/lysophospholipase [Flagelloscypha sp. PMI_526]